MPRDKALLQHIADEMSRCIRRDPEYRKPPGDAPGSSPFRVVGFVDGHIIARRKSAALALFDPKKFDQWPETDKDGKPLNPPASDSVWERLAKDAGGADGQ